MNKVEEKIRDLREEVIKHDLAYAKGDPIISDTEYDKLYLKLVGLEELYPEYSDENSPTKRIIDIKVEGLKKVEHTIPMLSQKKINTPDELDKFIRQMNDELLVEDKLDGLTVIAKYNNGVLYEGITRGDGKLSLIYKLYNSIVYLLNSIRLNTNINLDNLLIGGVTYGC
ncbi:hypothetical protein OKS12_13200 [Clostridioides difficile]|nr:hypothetical protein [Clostridioides difficile]